MGCCVSKSSDSGTEVVPEKAPVDQGDTGEQIESGEKTDSGKEVKRAVMPFLHGVLYVTIEEAANLPDADRAFFNVGKDRSDAYVTVDIGTARVCKTCIMDDNLNPKWGEKFRFDVAHEADEIIFKVKDKDFVGVGDLGMYRMSVEEVLAGEPIEGCFNLEGEAEDATITLSVSYQSAESLEKTVEVPNCYFPQRDGCKVTLYQDAHTPAIELHESIQLASGEAYTPACAWRDVYNAIKEAQHFIYLTGWSVYTATSLLREEDDDKVTVGELIQQKARDGVRILALIWNEKLSTDLTPGLMGTHDEETLDFFADSDVEVKLLQRRKNKGSFLEDQFVSTCYSHHQKCLIMDSPDPGGEDRRRILAFVGGLDLTDGRWDTPKHPLFSSLKDNHENDFYNKCVNVRSEAGPRQPWHDIHSRVEGPAALDVLRNFAERWRRQADEDGVRLIDLDEETFILEDPLPVEDESQSWSSQLFRSINVDSAVFDGDKSATLTRKKGRAVDDSIHRCYVHQIRRANNFIYIENQYFLGSAHCWMDPETKAVHLIPMEIAISICEKIAAGERFAAYIVLPMYPEGDPSSMAVQEILHWQTRTMEMMYKRIARALEENGSEDHPTSYLNFYCLGKREGEPPEDLDEPLPETPEVVLREKLRFMIYVHSKMMITDDEYIIVGSANINQRSMGGNRDTEIAIGAHQPALTMEACDGALPQGGVHGFRMALWSEHLAQLDDAFLDPGSAECVEKVNEIAQANLELFSTDDPESMEGYLLRYPIQVEQDGTVGPLPGHECFPDSSASCLGSESGLLPNKLTT